MNNPKPSRSEIDRRVAAALLLSSQLELEDGGAVPAVTVTVCGDDGAWTGHYCDGVPISLMFQGYN